MSRISFLAIGVICVLALTVPADDAPPDQPVDEPKAEYTLEIDGQSVEVRVGETSTVKINGKQVKLRLTPKATKLFREGGISFRYPSHHSFEVEKESSGLTTWTFDGNHNVIILMRQPVAIDAPALRKNLVDGMIEQYGRKNCKTSAVELATKGAKLKGTRLQAAVVGTLLAQDVYAWTAGDATFALIVQDSLNDDGTMTKESQEVIRLLESTLEVPEEKESEDDGEDIRA